jgi:SAM-dependent methyltransferase
MSTPSQNVYDNPQFFSAYGNLPRSQHGLSAAPEWPTLKRMITNTKLSTEVTESPLKGSRILDLGSGYGWFLRWARANGAEYLKGIDISQNMVKLAKETEAEMKRKSQSQGPNEVSTTEILFEVADLETITFDNKPEAGLYDMVYSSLTFHYIEDISRLFREIHTCLKKHKEHGQTGRFIFSIEHPVSTAPTLSGQAWRVIQEEGEDRTVWALNSYGDEGLRLTNWLGTEGVRKYHRTVETYVTALHDSGFVLTGLKDWSPSKEDIAGKPEWKGERHRPYFLLISAEARS